MHALPSPCGTHPAVISNLGGPRVKTQGSRIHPDLRDSGPPVKAVDRGPWTVD